MQNIYKILQNLIQKSFIYFPFFLHLLFFKISIQQQEFISMMEIILLNNV